MGQTHTTRYGSRLSDYETTGYRDDNDNQIIEANFVRGSCNGLGIKRGALCKKCN